MLTTPSGTPALLASSATASYFPISSGWQYRSKSYSRERCFRCWLDDHSTSSGESRTQLPGNHSAWEIPRTNVVGYQHNPDAREEIARCDEHWANRLLDDHTP